MCSLLEHERVPSGSNYVPSGSNYVPFEACRHYASSGTEEVPHEACRQHASDVSEHVPLHAYRQYVSSGPNKYHSRHVERQGFCDSRLAEECDGFPWTSDALYLFSFSF